MDNYINQISQRLHAPFPQSVSTEKNIGNVLAVGIFISVFLYYFFGNEFEQIGQNPLFLSLQFGLITVVGAFLYEGFVSYVLRIKKDHESWTFLKWILYMSFLLIFLAHINYGYFLFFTQMDIDLRGFLEITQHTIAVGILPVIFSGYIAQVKDQRLASLRNAKKNSLSEKEIVLYAKNQKEALRIKEKDILYIEAMENYVYVYYWKEDSLQKQLLRNTLKNMEEQVSETSLLKCHRSFLVNVQAIKKIRGNAQGLKLSLHRLDKIEIPVSRKYMPGLKSLSLITKT